MRTILHCDMNNFYASVECYKNPAIRNLPVAVGGNQEARHGIILAKNYIAKKYNIQTGEPIVSAKRKCPDLVVVPPDFKTYMEYSNEAREIYYSYTDQVESFGLDENWLDVTGSAQTFGTGEKIAGELREKIKKRLGVTISVGVSYNKIFAKLGSDIKKPDATTIISKSNYREVAWPLPASDLLYVGPKTDIKLKKYGIKTIGGIANTDVKILKILLGKNGEMLWGFANGFDCSPVKTMDHFQIPKSIGNSTTTYRDLVSDDDVKIGLMVMCESVASRMRDINLRCNTVQLHIRDKNLVTTERQCKLSYPCCDAKSLFEATFALYKNHFKNSPAVRSIGVRATDFIPDKNIQLSFDTDAYKISKQENLERQIDIIRKKYGTSAIRQGTVLFDSKLAQLDPKNDNVIYPESYFN